MIGKKKIKRGAARFPLHAPLAVLRGDCGLKAGSQPGHRRPPPARRGAGCGAQGAGRRVRGAGGAPPLCILPAGRPRAAAPAGEGPAAVPGRCARTSVLAPAALYACTPPPACTRGSVRGMQAVLYRRTPLYMYAPGSICTQFYIPASKPMYVHNPMFVHTPIYMHTPMCMHTVLYVRTQTYMHA